jgi:4,5-DOPA dioxygenase extradiol
MGSLSMTCYGVGTGEAGPGRAEGAASLPEGVPADQTNA